MRTPAILTLFIGLSSTTTALAQDVHQQLLELGLRQQEQRRAQFAAVRSNEDLLRLQHSLRQSFLRALDGLPAPAKGPPPAHITATIEADDYVIHKLAYESFPGYFVPALLYKPKKLSGPAPALISPCGHSHEGKAAVNYQILHVNFVKRGYIVLTYDPVGQGERSQFWDEQKQRSRFNLGCGEHAVLGNALELLGTNLARYRIWDGMRALDYLQSLPEVDGKRLGCVGNSGGGTLTAYIAALDPRVRAAAIGCYITNLPRRMGNRSQLDPAADPEQDVFGFVSEGIDHAGLLALRAPRPTLVASARFDFFPIEGARETVAEAKHLFKIAGAEQAVAQVEAAEKHGLTEPLRVGIYAFMDHWLMNREAPTVPVEFPVKPRSFKELRVCESGQANVSLKSKHLLTLALGEFERQHPARKERKRAEDLVKLLRLDRDFATFRTTDIVAGNNDNRTLVICVNGNEAPAWQQEKAFLTALEKRGLAVTIVDVRGVGALRPSLSIKGREYADPLVGVEENIAYNAFLTGKTLLGMRVADLQAAMKQLSARKQWDRIVLVGRKDAGLVAVMTAASLAPRDRLSLSLAVQEVPLSYRIFFEEQGRPINAASVLPGMLRDFGDLSDVFSLIAPNKVLISAGIGAMSHRPESIRLVDALFTQNPLLLE